MEQLYFVTEMASNRGGAKRKTVADRGSLGKLWPADGHKLMVVLGHSYVCNLQQRNVHTIEQDGFTIRVKYVGISGATYRTFITDARSFNDLERWSPDYVVVSLAGNSVGTDIPMAEVKRDVRQFYNRLRYHVQDDCIIMPVQCENREYAPNNRWGAPPPGRDWNARRENINDCLKGLQEKDFMVLLGGPENMDNISYLEDDKQHKVHLKPEALEMYWERILGALSTANTAISNRVARAEQGAANLSNVCQGTAQRPLKGKAKRQAYWNQHRGGRRGRK